MQLHPGSMRRMWTRRSTGKKLVVAGIGALAAGAIFLASGSSDEAARIDGKPLVPAAEAAAFANMADDVKIPAPKPVVPKPAAPVEIDLDKITLEGEHYIAQLADGRRAQLTLDVELQKLAEKLLVESR